MSEEEDFDHVGLVLQRTGEGDAIVEVLGEQEGIEILAQPSLWEVRAKGRLRLDYDELSEETGLEVDGSLIQVLMSTYYGRMVSTDDALLLFSDPMEAMEHM